MKCKDLIKQLDNPQEQLRAEQELIALAGRCVKALREFLLAPPRSSSPAWIRAVDILMRVDDEVYDFLEGLLLRPWVTDENTPERPAEEMLKDYIASVLMDISPSQRLRHSLLTVLERYKLLGAARALARKKDPEAIPYLLEMLEDDTKRRGAGGALLHYDERVLPYLVRDLGFARKSKSGEETPGSLLRRKKILSLLALMPWEGNTWIIKDYLDHKDLGVEAALALVQRGYIDEKTIEKLLEGFKCEDWFTSLRCKEALVRTLEESQNLSPNLREKILLTLREG